MGLGQSKAGALCLAVVPVLTLGGEDQTSHGQAEDQSDPTFCFRVYADVAFDDLTLVPGMPAEAFIKTVERSAMSHLLKPLLDSLQTAFREE